MTEQHTCLQFGRYCMNVFEGEVPTSWYLLQHGSEVRFFCSAACLDRWASHESLITSTRTCAGCGEPFHPTRTYQHYCRPECMEEETDRE